MTDRPTCQTRCDELREYVAHHSKTDRLPEESGRWLVRAVLELDERLKRVEAMIVFDGDNWVIKDPPPESLNNS